MSTHILPWPRPLRALPLLFLPFLALGCSGSSTEPEGGPPVIESLPRPLTSQETLLARAGNDFAFDLLKQVAGRPSRGILFLFPGERLHGAGMGRFGARRGETFAQMREMLGFGSLSRGGMGGGVPGTPGAPSGIWIPRVEFEVANSVWLREGFPVKPDWLAFVGLLPSTPRPDPGLQQPVRPHHNQCLGGGADPEPDPHHRGAPHRSGHHGLPHQRHLLQGGLEGRLRPLRHPGTAPLQGCPPRRPFPLMRQGRGTSPTPPERTTRWWRLPYGRRGPSP